MSVEGNTLPLRTRRQLAGECLIYGCKTPAKDDADYCHDHHERVKANKRRSAAKQRKRLRRSKLCATCARPSGKKYRCRRCAKEHRARLAGVDSGSRGVDTKTPKQVLTKLEVHPDGYTRVRTIGRGVRGQKSRSELDDDLRQDLTDAVADALAVRDEGIATLRTARVAELGRVQKREAQALVADRLLRARRYLLDVAESLCPGRAREMRAVIDDAES